MPITADQLAAALNAAGIDTQAELDAYAKSLVNKGPELEKAENRLKRLLTRSQADLNARQQRIDTLTELLNTAIRELKEGSDPTGEVPTIPQIDEVAPKDPFTPAP